jgi:ParB family chromosome partitioning protein
MVKAAKKIVFSRSRDIPFNKLVLSASNVRRIRPDQNIDELAEDIARREDLVQGLNVRPVLDADGNETGMFEVPAGGRRYRAIERLVKAKRFPKDGLVPCIVRDPSTKILAEDDSLAENVHRVALHPLDQFRAFLDMREKGMTDEEIAVAFFTTAQVVKQRLRLASVSPKLCEVYAEDGMTLEQLMAFSVTDDHARQEQVWDSVSRSGFDEPYSERAGRTGQRGAEFVPHRFSIRCAVRDRRRSPAMGAPSRPLSGNRLPDGLCSQPRASGLCVDLVHVPTVSTYSRQTLTQEPAAISRSCRHAS